MAKSTYEPKTKHDEPPRQTKDRYDPTSTLSENLFCGNPLKAAQNRNKRSEFDPSDRKSMDIRNILK